MKEKYAYVFLCSQTNSQMFTTCCEAAICRDDKKCPGCGAEIYGCEAESDHERDRMRWISVKTELPREGDRVDIYNNIDGRVPDVTYEGNNEWCAEYMRWSGQITHWMKISTPKQGGRG